MPPHIEHLLLASSEEARQLSPFADETITGGADVGPERVTAFEVGMAQPLGSRVTVDVAYWDRRFEDVSDHASRTLWGTRLKALASDTRA